MPSAHKGSTQRTAVVTGASSGFGRLTAEALAADGWRVFATLRDAAGRNANVAAELRGKDIAVVELDVTDDASVDAAAAHIHREAGAVDVLVNNAGSAFFGILEAFTPAAVEQQFATNVFGVLRVNRAFLPAMRERKSGLVVYVSSVVGRIIIPFSAVYVASKWALEAFAETSSYELSPFGIDVAIVEPGAYATDIFGKFSSADDTARAESYGPVLNDLAVSRAEGLAASSQGKDPADVAAAIVALANAPSGSRPLRTIIGGNPAADAINAAVAPIQQRLIDGMGYGSLASALSPR